LKKRILIHVAISGIVSAGLLFFARNSLVTMAGAGLESVEQSGSVGDLEGFAALEPVDTHTHAFHNNATFLAMMRRLHLHVLDIVVADDHNIFRSLQSEIDSAREFVQGSMGHATLCTTFNPFPFEKPGFASQAIEQLNDDFARGAVAVKIWKNIGMELKNADGKYIMPDDPIFEPIYRDIAAHGKTLIAHLAEPSSCWQAPNPDSPDYDYYKENPEWYMYLHPDHPSKDRILAARDHLLAENPKLRVVGAHLGSMETDVDEIARDFDRFPNFAVDTAARMEYLMIAPREKVRQFLIKYQDRVLYGTDSGFLVEESPADAAKEWQRTYTRDWKFFSTDEQMKYHRRHITGLKLPDSVLKKIYHDNAVRWIPGILVGTN
jgi:predicted TIM-barrel fold metal-dependent hydrolase